MPETEIDTRRDRWHRRPVLAPVKIFIGYATFVVFAMYFPSTLKEEYWAVVTGVLVFIPMILGTWTALASGSVLTRLPVVAGCLLLLCTIPKFERARMNELDRGDFIAATMIAFVLFIASLLIFLAVRRLTRLRIALASDATATEPSRVRFSIKYLLALLTLYAVALGSLSQLSFREAPEVSIFAPNFIIAILLRVTVTFSLAVLPTLAIPQFVLSGRPSTRAMALSAAFWAIVTLATVGFWVIHNESWTGLLSFVLMAQFGAAIAGALSALVLRRAGFRLLRLP